VRASRTSKRGPVSGSHRVTASDSIRRYTLRADLDGDALGLTCESDKANPPRKDGKSDLEWAGVHHTIYAQLEESVALEFADTVVAGRLRRVFAVGIDAQGIPHPWIRELHGAASPLIVEPKTADRTVAQLLVIIAAADDGSTATGKCPVKIVFGPRLG